ncbi:Armadillo-type fold [Nitzschia inconspicua]|uniref:Armadillo-type fold n=1 Tax=Nitzschia inconspicua TaxID=303405 RepID=A0A9K3LH60_9STRA|nr:Armadillo-type fold [Nitzschia inconspicua]
MRTKRASSSKEDSISSSDTKSTSSLSTSSLKQRAVDMIANGVDLSTFGEPKPDANTLAEIRETAERLATELDDYLQKNDNTSSYSSPFRQWKDGATTKANLSDEDIADLQLATARKLRELLPRNRDLLFTAQERKWIQVLLKWLTFHDRPAVQVESLLALTNIAELCAQQSYYQHTQAQSSAVAAAAQAAAAAVKGGSSSLNMFGNKDSPTTYPYPSLVAPAPGSVPFPPLSFSQTLSPEAVASFDASLTATIQNSSVFDSNKDSSKTNFSLPPAPLFPNAAQSSHGLFQNSKASQAAGINFTSLAPPPGGAHSAVPNNSFLPPPTPVPGSGGGPISSFPQQLSPSSQHLLLRHADAIPTLISLLSSPNKEVYEQSMWILGSIAVGDSPGTSSGGSSSSNAAIDGNRDKSVSARDVILAAGVMNQLLRCLEAHPENLSLQRIGSWTLSNLVEGIFQQSNNNNHSGKNGGKSGDYSSSDEIEMPILLPVLRRLLRMADSEVLSYTCWTLSHLCDGPSSHIAEVVTTKDETKAPRGGLVPRLVELLLHPSWRVTKPALRTIGNIVCAECSDDNNNAGTTTDYTEVILECGAVPRLKELITHSNREIQKEACWTLSNIAAGTVDQIQAVIDSGAIPPLVKLVGDKKTDQEVRSEACWVVLNATSCGADSQIELLVDEGCVAVLGVLLSEASMVMMALEGLERVLQVEETREAIRRDHIEGGMMEDTEATRTPTLVPAALIEKARKSNNSSAVTKRADRIWKQHFVSCALCKKSFSKHRTSDASFCDECKCYVCHNCNCKVYHLDYQEELWADETEKSEQKKKKSKSKKKKEKAKQKKAKQDVTPVTFADGVKDGKNSAPSASKSGGAEQSRSSTVSSASEEKDGDKDLKSTTDKSGKEPDMDDDDDDGDDKQNQQPAIDFVLYLQQTGSIIALAKLMDALEYGEDLDEGLDDSELRLIREQQLLTQQQMATR